MTRTEPEQRPENSRKGAGKTPNRIDIESNRRETYASGLDKME